MITSTRNCPRTFNSGKPYVHRRNRLELPRCSRGPNEKCQNKELPAASDWQRRARLKVRNDVISAGPRVGLQAGLLEEKLDVFATLLPNLLINLELMRASDWARVVADPDLAAKLIILKTAFPALNVELLLGRHPRVLLWSRQQLQDNLEQVVPVFQSLPRPEEVLAVLPELLDPRQCFSVVATLRKWWPKRDPLEVLQADPDVVRRAEQWDVPLEPVFFDSATGSWTSAGYSRNKQEDWQVYIEQAIYKRKPLPIDKQEVVVVGGSAAAAPAAAAVAEEGDLTAAGPLAAGSSAGDVAMLPGNPQSG